ncbi:MAG: hypothetical protein BJ554DRAFT_5166, partial [Olpidium bornovanus]
MGHLAAASIPQTDGRPRCYPFRTRPDRVPVQRHAVDLKSMPRISGQDRVIPLVLMPKGRAAPGARRTLWVSCAPL